MGHRGWMTSLLVPLLALAGIGAAPPAEAARCAPDGSGNWSCSHQKRYHYYFCNLVPVPRTVRWQVPEGTPPAGGWPVVFYYAGTQLTDFAHAFDRDAGESFGLEYEPRIMHELLDNPNGGGRKYAVFVADPPASGGFIQFWHTNLVVPYSASCDYDFLPDLFSKIKGGTYGPASQFNMNRRYAFGISSGGYNTSRMAVTFNSGSNANTWKALGIFAASYASCAAALCTVPSLPANHPPTKFWHGQSDLLAPISAMYTYYNKLVQGGFNVQKLEYPDGHEFTQDSLGPTGVKAWFDQF